MATRRAHVVLPEDLVGQIDKIVGARGRSAFLAELARKEIRRRHLLTMFQRAEPIWKDKDHPELKNGASKWVRKMRAEPEARFENIERKRDRS
ncbi:MAG TPA: hypothetical protein VIX89_17035 [Bryobacteraceae bacterium]